MRNFYFRQHSVDESTELLVLGSLMLAIISGHKRYAHISTLIGDNVNAQLIGMKKIVSDDTVRRGLKKIDEKEGIEWLQDHLHLCFDRLLTIPWIMDVDVTIKTIYGHQEGAENGYNPHKRGRPFAMRTAAVTG